MNDRSLSSGSAAVKMAFASAQRGPFPLDFRSGAINGVVTARLDRLTRSVVDFGQLLEEAKRDGWNNGLMKPIPGMGAPGIEPGTSRV